MAASENLPDIVTKTVQESKNVIESIKSLFEMTSDDLEKIANDESQSFVKRKLIQYISSDDPKESMDAIKWMYEVSKGDHIQTSIEITSIEGEDISMTESQEKIYKDIKQKLSGSEYMLIGDDHLLKIYAINLERFNQANLFIQQYGIKSKDKIRPEVAIMRESLATIKSISNTLGINTATRARLKIPTSIELSDPLNEL